MKRQFVVNHTVLQAEIPAY